MRLSFLWAAIFGKQQGISYRELQWLNAERMPTLTIYRCCSRHAPENGCAGTGVLILSCDNGLGKRYCNGAVDSRGRIADFISPPSLKAYRFGVKEQRDPFSRSACRWPRVASEGAGACSDANTDVVETQCGLNNNVIMALKRIMAPMLGWQTKRCSYHGDVCTILQKSASW